MFNKNIKIFSIIFLSVLFFGLFSISGYGKDVSRYEQFSNLTSGYKERAMENGVKVDDIEIIYPDNTTTFLKAKKLFPDISEMQGYTEELDSVVSKDGYGQSRGAKSVSSAYYVSKTLMTYEQFFNTIPNTDYDPSIDKNRMLWVSIERYPDGIAVLDRGNVDNAECMRFWDAETGVLLGGTMKSLDSNGMHLSAPEYNPDENLANQSVIDNQELDDKSIVDDENSIDQLDDENSIDQLDDENSIDQLDDENSIDQFDNDTQRN